jgi:hypothetical protein
MSKAETASLHLKNLADALIDNIIDAPDEEIFDEVRIAHEDSNFEAKMMKGYIQAAKVTVGREKFLKAQEELDAYKKEGNSEYEASFPKQFDDSDFEQMTIAARNGIEISENDKSKLLEDLEELRRKKIWKKKRSEDL